MIPEFRTQTPYNGAVIKRIQRTSRRQPWGLTALGLGLGALFWVIDSAVDVFLFKEGTLVQQIFLPEGVEVYMRITVVGLLTLLGFVAGLFLRHTSRLAGELLESERRTRSALAQVLSGYLPICAGCKMIRTDTEEWVPVADYLKENTKVELTHGVCPGCTKELLES